MARPLDADETWRARAWALVAHVEPASPAAVAARGLLLLGLGGWSLRFFAHSLDPVFINGSFLHLVNLPFHEAGHVLFSPFGSFLTSLGGSLSQVLVPLVCLGTFLVQTRDTYAAAVALWWAGQSLMDVAPYVADARALRMVLLGGHTGAEVEGHDWEAILGTLGWLPYDVLLGKLVNAAGIGLMLLGLGWGGSVVVRQWAGRGEA